MTQHSRDTPQFYLTAPSPCPYLPGKEERKVFTHIVGERAAGLNDAEVAELKHALGTLAPTSGASHILNPFLFGTWVHGFPSCTHSPSWFLL